MSDNPYRLPRSVIPTRYDLRIEPDLDAFTFTGSVRIIVEIEDAISEIVMNVHQIDVGAASLRCDQGLLTLTPTYDTEAQRVSLRLPETVAPGDGVVEIDFTGILNDELVGFYRSSFTDVDGVKQVVATTQFEATDARRAFPCFDEPDMKAVFGITLVVPEDLTAVSNSAEIARVPTGDGRVAITYADTMKMSTYLVAYVVGPFEVSRTVDVDGVPLRVVSPRGKGHLTEFALEAGAFCLRYLRDYYGIPYPGDKVDMVAIPDFAFGAMENLGCITFRESALLVDPTVATASELLRIVDVVAHELAHMWFGDLVTMKWWDGIWLNEAFATFMEMKATDAMRPDWKRWLTFGAVERPWAFGVDSLKSTRPVEFEVRSPEEANEMFDALTYGKGSSVLRMLEQFIGEEAFRKGVGNYLKKHAFDNTITEDLWSGLNEASGLAVGVIMDSWIHQHGYPRLHVETVDGGLKISQSRFLRTPDESDATLWQIPVVVRGMSNDGPFDGRFLLTGPEGFVAVDGEVEWVVGNAGGHGFYRTSYEPALAASIVENLASLTDLERFCLADDAWAFVEAGTLPASEYLELIAAYRDESESEVWQTVLQGLGSVRHHLVDDSDLPRFREIASEILDGAFARLGWEPSTGESDLTRRLRGSLLSALGRVAEDPAVIDQSRRLASTWLSDRTAIDPDVAQAALFNAAAHGDDQTFDRIFSAYRNSATPQEEVKLLQALSFFEGENAVDRMLDAVKDGEIRTQDASWVTARLFRARTSGEYAWQQVRKQWKTVSEKMPTMTIRRLIEGIPVLSDPRVAADVAAFFAETPIPLAAKTIEQNLERLHANVMMRQREAGPLAEYLRS